MQARSEVAWDIEISEQERERASTQAADVLVGGILVLLAVIVVGSGTYVGVRQGWIWGTVAALLVAGGFYFVSVECVCSMCAPKLTGLEFLDQHYPRLSPADTPRQDGMVGVGFDFD